MKEERRWVIIGKHGLYTGQQLTRREAIAQHVAAIWSGRHGFGDISPFGVNQLDAEQYRAWQLCRKNGDRTVQCLITWRES